MNGKTARLVKKYAAKLGKNEKHMKHNLNSLPSNKRHEERKRMQNALGYNQQDS